MTAASIKSMLHGEQIAHPQPSKANRHIIHSKNIQNMNTNLNVRKKNFEYFKAQWVLSLRTVTGPLSLNSIIVISLISNTVRLLYYK